MNHFPQRTTLKGCTSLQRVRDGVVVRSQTTVHHLGEDMKGVIEFSIEKETFDDGVAYAKCGVVNAFKDSASIGEASLMRVGAESQEPAKSKGVGVKARGEYLGMGLLEVLHVLALLQ
ncbi:hypothetical protein E2542_SST05881 [Spatholobus suberectus]|nr:hypothetical protein E2542_SST05881 [Spatholobus suberectus]